MRGLYGHAAYQAACRFCGGKGCFDCDVKSARACDESFSNPQVFKTDSPEGMQRLRDTFGADKLSTPEGLATALRSFTRPADSEASPEEIG